MVYQIELTAAALRALKRIDRQDHARIRGAISLLATDPRPPGATPLKGRDGWRVRVGNYRIIYTVQNDRLIVVVVAIGHRKDVYEK
ncbi:type II toxin-antitoxin system RelE/ParE family toxin [Citricoccus sp. NPDC055426]|uniref:type II toxin-antitoxin system RelE family toxin n=1 Tax=Citricoccus sp. NPDC055426 TaxID=3155536 RepID=UPI003428D69B